METLSAAANALGPMVTTAKEALSLIEIRGRTMKAQNEALNELRISIESLKRDAIGYKMLLESVIKACDKKHLKKLCTMSEGIEAIRNLELALKFTVQLLNQNQTSTYKNIPYGVQLRPGSKRPLIKDLIRSCSSHYVSVEKHTWSSSKLSSPHEDQTDRHMRDTSHDIDMCRNECAGAFKGVWYLYIMYQQAPHWRSSFYNDYRGEELGYALNNVLVAFNKTPFSVSAVGTDYIPTDVLMEFQRSHQCALEHKKIMERAGKAWVDERLDRLINHNRSGRLISKVQALGQIQTSLLELLWTGVVEQLKKCGSQHSSEQEFVLIGSPNLEEAAFKEDLADLEQSLLEAILRAKKQRFAISFCGMVKAGKSLFLNALIGERILPSGELPSTAWPCRLRHVPGQTIPQLEFDDGPFLSGIAALQREKFGAKLRLYQPPSENIYDVMFEGEPEEPSPEEIRLKELHAQWVDLHVATKKNLLEFEKPDFHLPSRATGHEDVKKLLSQLNDIVRLCHKFKLGFDMEDIEWPLLTVEFNSLRGHQMDGIYEFIDLPGIGEKFETFDFESMIRLVAKDSNAIVPIISFKELARSDWKKLPEIMAQGFGGRIGVVVCTHLDHVNVSDLEELLITASKVFWPRNIAMGTQNIIACSSLMGLSARALLDMSTNAKPDFESFWDKQRKKVEYPCAEKILGTGRPKETYDRLSTKTWREELEHNLEESGLPSAINKLTSEMVDQAKQRAYFTEAVAIHKQLRKMNLGLDRELLEARRSKAEFNQAKKEYQAARLEFFGIIESWDVAEYLQVDAYESRMFKGIGALRKRIEMHIKDAISKTLTSWSLRADPSIEQDDSGGILGRESEYAEAKEEDGVTVLVVKSVAHAEEFLRLSQRELQTSLNHEKQEFVAAIRRMAEEARATRFQELKDKFTRIDPLIQAGLREEIIEDLDSQSVDVRQVVFNHIRNEIKTTRTRHTAVTAFRAIEEILAKPLLSQKDETPQLIDEGERKALKTIDDLGFMFRAPLTAIATIPFVFGLPVWPWMVRARSFHLAMDVIESRYREEIANPWLNALQVESWKALRGTIAASTAVAREAVVTAIAREDGRYERESAHKNSPAKAEMLAHVISTQSNLCAAEGALMELQRLLKESIQKS
ncbi:hypothetical protein M408DRAFT_332082 [Serendipita vermifera MAFF 305830]|uniref:Dynamin N-terminal domain-containing protein n=1 Tax=Serendipita vermifera MAFF 305830 TaxID=933852 RepID=A0A0C3AGU2_SERVB|nr:hypothetical protein M408DRAFT_332082 [Serendipita vermifera MAFF 305830]